MNDNNPQSNHPAPNPGLSGKDILTDSRKLSFTDRLKATKTTRWIRFGVVSLLFFLWVIWMGNPWLGIFWLLLIDIYITAYIPWTWWKVKKGLSLFHI